jgi:beta-lactamase regulating signal transducer with metallopeptidase domain
VRVDLLVLALCAWLLTYAVHSTVLIAAAWASSGVLERFGRSKTLLAVVRERLWKLALVGGIATATLQTALGGGPWNLAAGLEEKRPAEVEELATLPASAPRVASAGTSSRAGAWRVADEGAPTSSLDGALGRTRARASQPDEVSAEPRTNADPELLASDRPHAIANGAERSRGDSASELADEGRPRGVNVPGAAFVPAVLSSSNDALASTPSGATVNASPAVLFTAAPMSATSAARVSARSAMSFSPVVFRTILALWIGGIVYGLLKWASDWRRLVSALECRVRIVSGAAHDVFHALVERAGVGGDVRLYSAPRIDAPITLGFAEPAICLPPRAEIELQRDELEALLAHELAHALRRDPAWLCACRAIEVVLFFQPLNRLARARLADEAEFLCDDWAVRNTRERLPLASCLTEIASWIVARDRELPVPAMAARGSRLELRVRRLLDSEEDERASAPRWIAPLAWSALGAVALFVPGVSAKESGSRAPATEFADASASIRSPAGERSKMAETADASDARDDEHETSLEDNVDSGELSLLAAPWRALFPSFFSPSLSSSNRCSDADEHEVADEASNPPCEPDPCTIAAPAPISVPCPIPSSIAGLAPIAAPAPQESPCPAKSSQKARASDAKRLTPEAMARMLGQPGPLVASPIDPSRYGYTGMDADTILALESALLRSKPPVVETIDVDDLRALQADVASLEETLQALKHELAERRAPAEFKKRVAKLESELRELRSQRNRLSMITGLAGHGAGASLGASNTDHNNTNDRK